VDQVSKPVLIALAAVLVFIAAHFTVLAPKADSGSAPPPKAPGQKGLETAISKANNAVAQSQASAKAAEKAAGQPAAATSTKGKAKATAVAKPKAQAAPAKPTPAAKPLPKLEAGDLSGPMLQDLANGKVVVALFYNPHASDDNAVLRALRSANTRHGRVVLHSIPIDNVGDYNALTTGVKILQTPTVLVMGPDFKASTIVGYTDVDSINQAVFDAGKFGKKHK
jgi:hypothetical protein